MVTSCSGLGNEPTASSRVSRRQACLVFLMGCSACVRWSVRGRLVCRCPLAAPEEERGRAHCSISTHAFVVPLTVVKWLWLENWKKCFCCGTLHGDPSEDGHSVDYNQHALSAVRLPCLLPPFLYFAFLSWRGEGIFERIGLPGMAKRGISVVR